MMNLISLVILYKTQFLGTYINMLNDEDVNVSNFFNVYTTFTLQYYLVQYRVYFINCHFRLKVFQILAKSFRGKKNQYKLCADCPSYILFGVLLTCPNLLTFLVCHISYTLLLHRPLHSTTEPHIQLLFYSDHRLRITCVYHHMYHDHNNITYISYNIISFYPSSSTHT